MASNPPPNMPKKKSPHVRAMEAAQTTGGTGGTVGGGQQFFDSADYEVKKAQLDAQARKAHTEQARLAPHVVSHGLPPQPPRPSGGGA